MVLQARREDQKDRQIWPESDQKPMTTQIEANAFPYQSLAGIEPEKSIPAGLF